MLRQVWGRWDKSSYLSARAASGIFESTFYVPFIAYKYHLSPSPRFETHLHQNQRPPVKALVRDLPIILAGLEQLILDLHKILGRAGKVWKLCVDLRLNVQVNLMQRIGAVEERQELGKCG
jgi:hypothetical protein